MPAQVGVRRVPCRAATSPSCKASSRSTSRSVELRGGRRCTGGRGTATRRTRRALCRCHLAGCGRRRRRRPRARLAAPGRRRHLPDAVQAKARGRVARRRRSRRGGGVLHRRGAGRLTLSRRLRPQVLRGPARRPPEHRAGPQQPAARLRRPSIAAAMAGEGGRARGGARAGGPSTDAATARPPKAARLSRGAFRAMVRDARMTVAEKAACPPRHPAFSGRAGRAFGGRATSRCRAKAFNPKARERHGPTAPRRGTGRPARAPRLVGAPRAATGAAVERPRRALYGRRRVSPGSSCLGVRAAASGPWPRPASVGCSRCRRTDPRCKREGVTSPPIHGRRGAAGHCDASPRNRRPGSRRPAPS